ncbi:MAG TPA: hypothetical protein VEQ11_06680 [Chloroflexota bacterium]|nr:hypothetical protein [Chloroflexota bacterium]
MEDGSQNGHSGENDQTPEEHRAAHYLNLLDETITLLVEDAADEDALDGVVDSVLLALVDAVATQGFRPPKALMDALGAWVGTEDPRAYLHNIYSDQHGRLADDTPEPISRYLRQTDDQYWTD